MVWVQHAAWSFYGAALACGVAALLLLRVDLQMEPAADGAGRRT
jgi:hypothetical protein